MTRVGKDLHELAASELNEKGLPGTEFHNRFKELADSYLSGQWKPFE